MVRSVLLQFSCLLLWRALMAYSGVHVILFTLFISGLFQHSSTLNKLGGIGGFQRTIICILMHFIAGLFCYLFTLFIRNESYSVTWTLCPLYLLCICPVSNVRDTVTLPLCLLQSKSILWVQVKRTWIYDLKSLVCNPSNMGEGKMYAFGESDWVFGG